MNELKTRSARWIAIVAITALTGCASPPSGGGEKTDSTSAAPAAAPAAPAAPAAGAAGPGADKAKIGELIKRYYAGSGQIPADVTIEVTEIKPAQVTGLNEGTIKLSRGDQSQEMNFLLSTDGRWFLRADPVDLTVDPIIAVVEKIDLGPQNPSLGPKDAKVTIVEYSDFQCPFCSRAETIVQEEVLKKYGDKVRFIYKQFPLTSIHPWAEPASLIGLCLYQQNGNDAYWKYHAQVFAKQSEITPDTAPDQLMKLATAAGGDEAKIKSCVEKEETAAIVAATLEEAEAIGVNSTPTFFINGKRLSGAQPLEAFQGIIDPELNAGG